MLSSLILNPLTQASPIHPTYQIMLFRECDKKSSVPNEMLQLYQIDLTEIVQKLEDKVMNLYLTKQGPAQHLGDSSFPPAKLEPLTRNHF